ncbi:MAG: aminoglycoside phosphotransferase family protein [Acidimicrobiia bacterium]
MDAVPRRLAWTALPEAVRKDVAAVVGAGEVVRTTPVDGGFTPGFAGSVETPDGRRAFVKAMARSAHPGWVFLYEREADIAPHLPVGPPFPRLLAAVDDGDWLALVFDWIDGRPPSNPWTAHDLDRVLAASLAMGEALTPSPAEVPGAGVMWGPWFSHWGDIADDPERTAALGSRWALRLEELVALDDAWPAAIEGDSLVHLDLRADNLLLTDRDVYVVDWAFGARAAPWVDLVCLLPGVAAQGGPDPESVWRAHPWHGDAPRDAFDAFLAGWAGMLTYFSGAADGSLVPELRTLHAAQAHAARRWLAERRGWTDLLRP